MVAREQLQQMFDDIARTAGWDMSKPMLWGYFFTHTSREGMERASFAAEAATRTDERGASEVGVGPAGAVAWEPALLSVGAEADAGTPWEGEVHRVSLHCRALTQAEVQADQALGP